MTTYCRSQHLRERIEPRDGENCLPNRSQEDQYEFLLLRGCVDASPAEEPIQSCKRKGAETEPVARHIMLYWRLLSVTRPSVGRRYHVLDR